MPLNHLPLYQKSYQLTKVLYRIVKNIPKEYKYSLGEDAIKLSWQCLDLILEANAVANNKKYSKILELSFTFDKLKIRIRMMQEIRLISEKQFAHFQTLYFQEIGCMVGGWMKWAGKLESGI